jgi:hypothetical protein
MNFSRGPRFFGIRVSEINNEIIVVDQLKCKMSMSMSFQISIRQ